MPLTLLAAALDVPLRSDISSSGTNALFNFGEVQPESLELEGASSGALVYFPDLRGLFLIIAARPPSTSVDSTQF